MKRRSEIFSIIELSFVRGNIVEHIASNAHDLFSWIGSFMRKVITKLWKNIKRVLYRHVVQPSNWKIRGSHVYVEQCCCVSHSQTVIYYRYSLPSRRSNFRGTGYKLFMRLFHVPLYFRWKGPLSSKLNRGKYVSFPSLSGETSFLILIEFRSFEMVSLKIFKIWTEEKREYRKKKKPYHLNELFIKD